MYTVDAKKIYFRWQFFFSWSKYIAWCNVTDYCNIFWKKTSLEIRILLILTIKHVLTDLRNRFSSSRVCINIKEFLLFQLVKEETVYIIFRFLKNVISDREIMCILFLSTLLIFFPFFYYFKWADGRGLCSLPAPIVAIFKMISDWSHMLYLVDYLRFYWFKKKKEIKFADYLLTTVRIYVIFKSFFYMFIFLLVVFKIHIVVFMYVYVYT